MDNLTDNDKELIEVRKRKLTKKKKIKQVRNVNENTNKNLNEIVNEALNETGRE